MPPPQVPDEDADRPAIRAYVNHYAGNKRHNLFADVSRMQPDHEAAVRALTWFLEHGEPEDDREIYETALTLQKAKRDLTLTRQEIFQRANLESKNRGPVGAFGAILKGLVEVEKVADITALYKKLGVHNKCAAAQQCTVYMHLLFLPGLAEDFYNFVCETEKHSHYFVNETVRHRLLVLTERRPGTTARYADAITEVRTTLGRFDWDLIPKMGGMAGDVYRYLAALWICCSINENLLSMRELMAVFQETPGCTGTAITLESLRGAAKKARRGTIAELLATEIGRVDSSMPKSLADGDALVTIDQWKDLVNDTKDIERYPAQPGRGQAHIGPTSQTQGATPSAPASPTRRPGASAPSVGNLPKTLQEAAALFFSWKATEREAYANGICTYCGHPYRYSHRRDPSDPPGECPVYRAHPNFDASNRYYLPCLVRMGAIAASGDDRKKN